MLCREDMLELTRRMNPARNCFVRLAGSYRDGEGFDSGSFNINFLKLSPQDRARNIAIAKAVPFAETNVRLKEFSLAGTDKETRQFKALLAGLKECGLKNDALLETFYDFAAEKYMPKHTGKEFAIYVFYGVYDIKAKASDKEYLDDSEEVYDFLICTICPTHGDYEADAPVSGFLWPSFKDRCPDEENIAVMN